MNPEWRFLMDTVVRWLPYIAVILFIPFSVLLVRCLSKGSCRNGPVQKLNSFTDEEFWAGDQDYLKKRQIEALKTEHLQKHKSLPHLQENHSQTDEVFKSVNLTRDPSGHASVEPINVHSSERGICSLCQTIYTELETAKNLPCSHHFHQKCAEDWFSKRGYCPQCIRPSSLIKGL